MKKNIYKPLLFSIIFASFLFSFGQTVFALEIDWHGHYPNILGLPAIDNSSKLPDYVSYIFGLATYIAGVVAVISLAIGAVQLILAASDPSMVSEAKERIRGAILGLILTVSAVVILQSINSAIISPTLTALPEADGVFLTNGSKYRTATESANISNVPVGYGTLYYRCSSGPALLVWLFNKENQEYDNGAITQRIPCGNSASNSVSISSAKSFRWAYETTGVYYCLGGCSGNMCSGYMSDVNLSSQEEIATPFKGNIKGVRLVNNTDDDTYYGIILHKEVGVANAGECTDPIVSTNSSICQGVDVAAFSADIFLWNKVDPDSSGDGITFYSETYGWDADVQSGELSATQKDIKNAGSNVLKGAANKMIFDFSGVESEEALYCDSEEDYPSCNSTNDDDEDYVLYGMCCPCSTFQDCPGSIRVKGDYIVGLYSYIKDEKGNKTKKLYCQTFIEDVENLDAYDYVQPGNLLEYVDIIPIKS